MSHLPIAHPPFLGSGREPKHLYKGSVFSIEPPIVSLKDEAIYEEAARVAQTGVVLSPGKESMDLYTTYVRGYLI